MTAVDAPLEEMGRAGRQAGAGHPGETESVTLSGTQPGSAQANLITGDDLPPGVVYTLTINNVQDLEGTVIASTSSKTFRYSGISAIHDRRNNKPYINGAAGQEERFRTIWFLTCRG